MKKSLMILAVLAGCFMASASTVNWGMMGIQNLNDGNVTIDKTTMGNFTAYLIDASFSEDQLVSAISGGTLAGNIAVSETVTLKEARGDIRVVSSGTDKYVAGTTYEFYTAIVGTGNDGNTYYLMTESKAGSPEAAASLSMDWGSMSAGQYKWQSLALTPGGGDGTPEPTSGLLLLVGGALLALRRKQK